MFKIIFWIAFPAGILYFIYERICDFSRINQQIKREKAAELAFKKQKEAKKTELLKQLEAIQYQLKLMEALDNFRSNNMSDEKEVKKALILEKQYAALYQKERKLKTELEKL